MPRGKNGGARHGQAVLVVDDDPGTLATVTSTVAALGHHTITGMTGREALSLAARHNPAVVLVRAALPDDGVEVAMRLKRDLEPAGTVVALMFGPHTSAAEQARGLNESLADCCLNTGLAHAEFQARIDAFLRIHATRAQTRTSESRYRAAIESSSNGFLLFDVEGRVLEANEAYVRRSGYSREELLRMRLADLRESTEHQDATARLARVRERGAEVYETEHQTKEGTRWPIEVSMAYWPIEGGRFFAFVHDVTRRRREHERLVRYQARLRALASELVSSRHDERVRLGIELHDGIGQRLAAIKMAAQAIAATSPDPGTGDQARRLVELVGESLHEVRLLTTELVPPVLFELGLGPAVLWQRDRYARIYGLHCAVRMNAAAKNLRGGTAALVLRFTGEALNNVVRHSRVLRTTVTVTTADGWMTAVVSDRGVGCDPALVDDPGESGGLGLFGIREECLSRGGTMGVTSAPGRGTRVKLRIPDSTVSG